MGLFKILTPDPKPGGRKPGKAYKQPKPRRGRRGGRDAAEALRRAGQNGFYDHNR
jgi:hypothetical protein